MSSYDVKYCTIKQNAAAHEYGHELSPVKLVSAVETKIAKIASMGVTNSALYLPCIIFCFCICFNSPKQKCIYNGGLVGVS